MGDNVNGTTQANAAPTYVQGRDTETPAVTTPTDVHAALTASTGANETSIGNLDEKNRRMYKHVPAEMRRDWLEDEAERDRVEANQDAVIEDHVGRLANRSPERYGHLTGKVIVATKYPSMYEQNVSVQPFRIDDGNITINGAGNAIMTADYNKPVASPGIVYPGTGMQIDIGYRGKLDLKPATASEIGGVKPSDSISVADDGTAKVSDAIFGEPLEVVDGKVTVKHDDSLVVGADGTLGVAGGEELEYDSPVVKQLGHVKLLYNNTLVSANNNLSVNAYFHGFTSTDDFNAHAETSKTYGTEANGYTIYGVRLVGSAFSSGDNALFIPRASSVSLGVVKPGKYTTVDDHGVLSVELGGLASALAGDALYYDSKDGLMVKVSDGLEIQNDAIAIDQDKLPLASKTNRGTVKVGDGLAIAADGTLSATGGSLAYGDVAHFSATGPSDLNEELKLTYSRADIVGVYDAEQSGNVVRAAFMSLSFTVKAAFAAGTTIMVGFDEFTTNGGDSATEVRNILSYPNIVFNTYVGDSGEANQAVVHANVQQGEYVAGHTFQAFNFTVREAVTAGTTIYATLTAY